MTYAELASLQYGSSKSFADAQTEALSVYCQAEHDLKQLQAENAKLRELCEWLLTPYRLGAVTGEGVDRQWCRETYDGGSYRLRELGVDDG